MPLSTLHQCFIDPHVSRITAVRSYNVTVVSDDGERSAVFNCETEREAIKLRNAIREHADFLVRTTDYSR